MTASPTRALVLGGGGLTGIAWETGLLLGLERLGIHLTHADLIVGSSAGSTVAAQVAGQTPLETLYRSQIEGDVDEIAGSLGAIGIVKLLWALRGRDEQAALARVGRLALQAETVAEPVRHAVIEQRLPVHAWPERRVRITATNAITGELTVFESDSGVDLVDAVAASCAVPMVWPSVTIGSERYFDGGIRSVANVDLAAGHDRVVVIAPQTTSLRRGSGPAAQLAALDASGWALVSPDAAAKAAMGRNSLDPAARAASAAAGLAQAERVSDEVRAAWA